MAQPPGVFLRRASGLVRDWSLFDAFALQSFSQPFMAATLIFAYAPFWPNSNLILGIILVTVMATFQCIIYTFMVTTMPRAGADYVWQSRILHPALGFAIIFPGYLIVLPSWITIITYAFDSQFISPMLALFGNLNAAYWVIGNDGLFVTTIIVLIYTFIVCSLGLRWFARIQSVWFWLAMIGVFATIGGLWLSSPATFQAGLNSFYTNVLGYSGSNAYQDIITTAQKQGLSASLNWDWAQALPLLPLLTFYGIWPTWSAPMYGEVRGADSVKKVHLSFQMANIPLNVLNVLLVLAVFSTVGFQFFQSSNYLFWLADTTHMPLFPSIPLWVYFATGSLAITSFIMIFNILMGLTQNGAGNGYLIVSRMLFAMSFDQALPSLFASIKTRWRVPMSAYVYTFVIALIFSWLYSYNVGGFRTVFLDSTGVLLIAFTVTAIAAVVLPFRRRDIFKASPASKYMIGKLPLMSLCGLIYIGFALFTFYYWIIDPLYGVNNPLSAELLATVYVLGLIIFFAFKYYRKREGIDLNLTYKEVPAE